MNEKQININKLLQILHHGVLVSDELKDLRAALKADPHGIFKCPKCGNNSFENMDNDHQWECSSCGFRSCILSSPDESDSPGFFYLPPSFSKRWG